MIYFSAILNIVLGMLTFYLYFENHKFKKLEVEKDLELKKLQLKELESERDKIFAFRTVFENPEKLIARIEKIKTEISYLEKLKRYKWIFSK